MELGTKRTSFRFKVDESIKFIIQGQEGFAKLINISTGGFLACDPTLQLDVEDEILVIYDFENQDNPSIFEAIVKRVNDNEFSVEFTQSEFDSKFKNDFVKTFAKISKRVR